MIFMTLVVIALGLQALEAIRRQKHRSKDLAIARIDEQFCPYAKETVTRREECGRI
jgi:hypothetical protein